MLLANTRKSSAFAINLYLVTSVLVTVSVTSFPSVSQHTNITLVYIQTPISAPEKNMWDSSCLTLPLQNIYTAELTVLTAHSVV